IDHVREHAVLKLPGYQGAELFLCNLRLKRRKHDGMEAGIPKPLVRIGIWRRHRIEASVCLAAIAQEKRARFCFNIHYVEYTNRMRTIFAFTRLSYRARARPT